MASPIVLVGGSGFIGTRLASRFAARADMVIADIVPSRTFPDHYVHADVTDLASLHQVVPVGATIVNLAAEHRDDVMPLSRYWDVNVEGARNVCAVATARDVSRILFTSSVAVYGFSGTPSDERAPTRPFNEYGRTKLAAEEVFRQWQREDPQRRSLVILRPTVVFGERNRGNVYNLLRHLAANHFVMVGKGTNRKSMVYVENVAAAIEHCLGFGAGEFTYNCVDKPDYSMNELVVEVRRLLGRDARIRLRLPYWMGYTTGCALDLVARLARRTFPLSAVRVKKFCSDTLFASSLGDSGFVAPVPIAQGLRRTVTHEFLERHDDGLVFHGE